LREEPNSSPLCDKEEKATGIIPVAFYFFLIGKMD
jgi:hypothetical protein